MTNADVVGESSAWTHRQRMTLVAALAVVILQVAIPLMVLSAGPNRDAKEDEPLYRFGWQMFTETDVSVTYSLVRTDGSTAAVRDPSDLIGGFWGHVDYGPEALRRMCDATDAAVVLRTVRARSNGDERVERHTCR